MRFKTLRFSSAVVVLICLFAVACSKNETAPASPAAVAKVPGQMQAVLSDSLVTVTAVKDGNIPVKGSLSLSEGVLQKMPSGAWQARIVLDLNSWNSGLALRDQRVRDIFFEVAKPGFDKIVFTADNLPADAVAQQQIPVDGQLTFAGLTQPVRVLLSVKEENGQIVVTSGAPVSIEISAWGLDANKARLMQACNHREIQNAVLVSFSAKFE